LRSFLFKELFVDEKLIHSLGVVADDGDDFYYDEIMPGEIAGASEYVVDDVLDVPNIDLTSVTILYNDGGYTDSSQRVTTKCFNGPPVFTLDSDNDAVGYYIYLPPSGRIKSIIINVYGGEKKDSQDFHTLYSIEETDLALLKKDIAVVYLNLPDLKLNDQYQGTMNKAVHDRILKSIAHFWHSLKNAVLFQWIKETFGIQTNTCPIILSGGSFGGLNALLFSENYPDTFDGYILFNPAIKDDHDLFHRQSASYLNPETKISNVKKPIHIIQSYNDHNTPMSDLLDFLHKVPAHKKDLFSFLGVPFGNIKDDGEIVVGHSIPLSKTVLDSIINFIDVHLLFRGNLETYKEIQKSRLHHWDALSKRFTKNISFEEKFLSEAYAYYVNQRIHKSKEIDDIVSQDLQKQSASWNQHFLPILCELYLKNEVDYYLFDQHKIQDVIPANLFTWKLMDSNKFSTIFFAALDLLKKNHGSSIQGLAEKQVREDFYKAFYKNMFEDDFSIQSVLLAKDGGYTIQNRPSFYVWQLSKYTKIASDLTETRHLIYQALAVHMAENNFQNLNALPKVIALKQQLIGIIQKRKASLQKTIKSAVISAYRKKKLLETMSMKRSFEGIKKQRKMDYQSKRNTFIHGKKDEKYFPFLPHQKNEKFRKNINN
jgi:hypothetical protein